MDDGPVMFRDAKNESMEVNQNFQISTRLTPKMNKKILSRENKRCLIM
jgi:hypothetical protein